MWTRTPLDEALAWMGVGAALVGMAVLIPDVSLKDRSADSIRPPVQVAPRYRATYTRLSGERTRVDLHDDQTGRKLWSVTTGLIPSRAWSQDGRAFALVAKPPREWRSRLLLWREGGRPTWHDTIRPLEQLDCVTRMEWSPDKRWLLTFSWTCTPMETQNAWSLDTLEVRSRLLSDSVKRAEWLDEGRVRVWTSRWIKGVPGQFKERKAVSVFDVRSQPQPDPDE